MVVLSARDRGLMASRLLPDTRGVLDPGCQPREPEHFPPNVVAVATVSGADPLYMMRRPATRLSREHTGTRVAC